MNRDKMKEVASSLKFKVNDEILDHIEVVYNELEIKIKAMQEIDTNGIEPMTRVDNTPISFLREDVVTTHLPKELILKNAPHSDDDFVIINKKGESND